MKTKKEQIEEFAVRNDIDIITDMEINKSMVILKHANGKESHIWVNIKPLVKNDNCIIVDYQLNVTKHQSSLDVSNEVDDLR